MQEFDFNEEEKIGLEICSLTLNIINTYPDSKHIS